MTDTTATANVVDPFGGFAPTGWRGAMHSFTRFMLKKRLGAFGLILIVFFTIVAVFAPVVGRYDPDEIFQAPNPNYKSDPSIAELAKDQSVGSPDIVDQYASPNAKHWFGTDKFGRDIYSRIVHGAKLSLTVGLGASVIALAVGLILGVLESLGAGLISSGYKDAIAFLWVIYKNMSNCSDNFIILYNWTSTHTSRNPAHFFYFLIGYFNNNITLIDILSNDHIQNFNIKILNSRSIKNTFTNPFHITFYRLNGKILDIVSKTKAGKRYYQKTKPKKIKCPTRFFLFQILTIPPFSIQETLAE